jgi:GxxExxY protein
MLLHQDLSERVIDLAIEIHRTIGPGLLESVYRQCLAFELEQAAIPVQTEVAIPVIYKNRTLPLGFRADIVVSDSIIIEVKAVSEILPVHQAQVLTYLRMSHIKVGLIMNFHAPRLKHGLLRCVV